MSKVILATRSIKKGEAVKAEIEAEINCMGVVGVDELDYSCHDSVRTFVARVAVLERVDIVVLTAGVATE